VVQSLWALCIYAYCFTPAPYSHASHAQHLNTL